MTPSPGSDRKAVLTGVIPGPRRGAREPCSGARGARLRRRQRTALALAVFLWAIVATACSPKYYVPGTQNVPLLQHQGDAAASYAGGEWRSEFHGAYAVTDQAAVMLNASFFYPEDDEEGDGGDGQLLEAGLGYHRDLARRMVIETYGLLGMGRVENHFPSTLADNPSTTGQIRSTLLRIGSQSSLGFRSRYVDAAASTRVALLNYLGPSGSLAFAGEDQVEYLERENLHVLVEPALTVRAGIGPFKLQAQLGKSYNLTNPDFRQDDGHFTLGVGYFLSR